MQYLPAPANGPEGPARITLTLPASNRDWTHEKTQERLHCFSDSPACQRGDSGPEKGLHFSQFTCLPAA